MHAPASKKPASKKPVKKTSKPTPMSDTRRAIQPVARVVRPTAVLLGKALVAAQALWTGTAALTGAGTLTETLRHGPAARAVLTLGAHHVLAALVIALLFSAAAVLVLDQDATDDLAQAPAPHLHWPVRHRGVQRRSRTRRTRP